MKKRLLATTMVSLAAFLAACGTVEKEQEKVVNTENVVQKETYKIADLEFGVPAGFELMSEDNVSNLPTVVYYTGDKNSFNVVVEDISLYPGLTLEEYIEASKNSTGFEYLEEKNYKIIGKEVSELVSMNQGVKLSQKTIIHNGKAYIFTYGAMPTNYESEYELINDIVENAKFE